MSVFLTIRHSFDSKGTGRRDEVKGSDSVVIENGHEDTLTNTRPWYRQGYRNRGYTLDPYPVTVLDYQKLFINSLWVLQFIVLVCSKM